MPNPVHPMLPNLIIAGVTKAGTTSLHHYLGQHPSIGIADLKEVDHYAPMVEGREPPSLDDYALHFQGCGNVRYRMDASPRYFIGGLPLVQRIAGDLDSPRVMISIREPTARMWSSYTYKRSKGRLPTGMTFRKFIDACEHVHEEGLVRDPDHAAFRTLASGVYVDFLTVWFDVLGDNVRVVFFDDLARPQAELARLFTWLDIDGSLVRDFDLDARNATYQPRSRVLRNGAQSVNRRLKRLLPDDSALKRAARAGYEAINTGDMPTQSAVERDRVQAFYAPTLAPLRRLLAQRGQVDVPSWLAEENAP